MQMEFAKASAFQNVSSSSNVGNMCLQFTQASVFDNAGSLNRGGNLICSLLEPQW